MPTSFNGPTDLKCGTNSKRDLRLLVAGKRLFCFMWERGDSHSRLSGQCGEDPVWFSRRLKDTCHENKMHDMDPTTTKAGIFCKLPTIVESPPIEVHRGEPTRCRRPNSEWLGERGPQPRLSRTSFPCSSTSLRSYPSATIVRILPTPAFLNSSEIASSNAPPTPCKRDVVYLPKRVVGVDHDHQITCKPCTLDLLRDTQVTGDHDKEMHSSGMEYGN